MFNQSYCSHMGEEVVLLCSSKGGEWYWNNGKQPEKIENISPKKISNVEGKLLCEIQTDMVFKIGDASLFRQVNFSNEVSIHIVENSDTLVNSRCSRSWLEVDTTVVTATISQLAV